MRLCPFAPRPSVKKFMNVTFSQYRQLLGKYLAPQRKRMAGLALLMLVDLTLQLALPRVVQGFIDNAIAGVALQTLLIIGVGYLVVAIVGNWSWVGWQYVANNIGLIATNRIRADLTLHCLKLDMSFHNARTPGEMIERVDGDVTKLGNFLSTFVVQITLNGLLLIGVLTMLFSVDWRVGLPITLGVMIAIITSGRLTRPLAQYAAKGSAPRGEPRAVTLGPYDYAVVRVVPRVDREEFTNVGVIVFARPRDFLACRLDERAAIAARVGALAATVNRAAVQRHLDAVVAVCAGATTAGSTRRCPRPSASTGWSPRAAR